MKSLSGQGATGVGIKAAVVFGIPCSVATFYNGNGHWDNSKCLRKSLAGVRKKKALSENQPLHTENHGQESS